MLGVPIHQEYPQKTTVVAATSSVRRDKHHAQSSHQSPRNVRTFSEKVSWSMKCNAKGSKATQTVKLSLGQRATPLAKRTSTRKHRAPICHQSKYSPPSGDITTKLSISNGPGNSVSSCGPKWSHKAAHSYTHCRCRVARSVAVMVLSQWPARPA